MILFKRTIKRYCLILAGFMTLLYLANLRESKSSHQIKKLNSNLTIIIKTTFKNHEKMVIPHLIDTWYKLAPDSVFFVSDTFDPILNKTLNGHLKRASCDNGQNLNSPGCTMHTGLQHMLHKKTNWSCIFNDDTYVNIPLLEHKLKNISHEIPYYLGITLNQKPIIFNGEIFWYAKNGACLSKAALEKIAPKILDDQFYLDFIVHDKMPAELALGYIMKLNGIVLTEVSDFYAETTIPLHQLNKTMAITCQKNKRTLKNLPYFYEPQHDPCKFHTLHCFLFQHQCNKMLNRLNINILQKYV